MRISKKNLKVLIENFLFEQEGDAPPGAETDETEKETPDVDSSKEDVEEDDEEEQEESFSIDNEDVRFKEGTLSVSFRDLEEDIKVSIKDKSDGEDISSLLKPKHGSAILIKLYRSAQKEKNEDLLNASIHFIKKYHKDLPDDVEETALSEWIKSKNIRYLLIWTREIDKILKRRKNTKSIK